MSETNKNWAAGAIFRVEQSDGRYCLGQVLDLMLPNAPSCSFYNLRYSKGTHPSSLELPFEKLISAVTTTRERLDSGEWEILSAAAPALDRQFWPNEAFRDLGWVGAKTYGAVIVEKFLEAYFGIGPWDAYADLNYFEQLLFFPNRKPGNLTFKRGKR